MCINTVKTFVISYSWNDEELYWAAGLDNMRMCEIALKEFCRGMETQVLRLYFDGVTLGAEFA